MASFATNFVLSTFFLFTGLGNLAVQAGNISEIDAVLQRAVNQGDVPGVVAIAATSQGIIYQGAFGKRNVAQNEAMTLDTIFRIASMTKPVTSVAAMQLVEERVLTLDTKVAQFLPSFADLQVLKAVDRKAKKLQLRRALTPVTVRHLLTHTAGFGYEFWNPLLHEAVEADCLPSIFDGGHDFLSVPLPSDPGERWMYGINTNWLGRLVEAVHKSTLDQIFQERLLMPLGMNDTHFNLPAEKVIRLATQHHRSAAGDLKELARSAPAPVTYFNGGGGLYSTAPDYTRFLRALLRGGELGGNRILRAKTVRMMQQNHIGDLEAGRMRTVMPHISNDVDFFPGSVDHFGLGFLINSNPVPGGRSAGSLAWAGIFNTYFWLDPKEDVCGVIMTQLLPFYDAKVIKLLDDFERAVYELERRRRLTKRAE